MATKPHSFLSPAKVNLFLEVLEKRPDGFHNIESVFQAVSLADRLDAQVTEDDGKITLETDHPDLPTDSGNLVVRAAEMVREKCGSTKGLHFKLQKNIPLESGLGGGSSNAATALRLANILLRANFNDAILREMAAELGSDVPFFLYSGACLCKGRGEEIEPVEPLASSIPITVLVSDLRSPTKQAYAGLKLPGKGEQKSSYRLIRAMAEKNIPAQVKTAFNRFEPTVFAAMPELWELHRLLSRIPGLSPRMSGSGSSLWLPVPSGSVDLAIRNMPSLGELAEKINLKVIQTYPLGARE